MNDGTADADGTANRIIVFDAIRSGQGRKMAVANLSALLVASGKSVLVVEGMPDRPILRRYFDRFTHAPAVESERLVRVAHLALPSGERLNLTTSDDPRLAERVGSSDYDQVIFSDIPPDSPVLAGLAVDLVILGFPLAMNAIADVRDKVRELSEAGHRVWPIPMKVAQGSEDTLESIRRLAQRQLGGIPGVDNSFDVLLPYDSDYYFDDALILDRPVAVRSQGFAAACQEVVRRIAVREKSRQVLIYHTLEREPWAEWLGERFLAEGAAVRHVEELPDDPDHRPELADAATAGKPVVVLISAPDGKPPGWLRDAAADSPEVEFYWLRIGLRLDPDPDPNPPVRQVIDLAGGEDVTTVLDRLIEENLLSYLSRDVTDPASGARYPGIPPEGNIPARATDFVGRHATLHRLRADLLRHGSCLLHGPTGRGKSALAEEYARVFGSCYDLVWRISAGERWGVRRGLGKLAVRLGLRSGDGSVRTVLDELANRKRWLLIFDNAAPEAVEGLLPEEGAGHLLFTGESMLPVPAGIEVEPFTPEESVALLRRRLPRGQRPDDGELRKVAELAGHGPLALELIGGWLRRRLAEGPPGQRVDAHLSTFLSRHQSLYRDDSVPVGYQSILRASVEDLSLPEKWLLSVASSLSPDGMSLELLRWAMISRESMADPALARDPETGPMPVRAGREQLQVDAYLETLRRLALIKLDREAGSVRMDRGIAGYVRAEIAPDHVPAADIGRLLARYAAMEIEETGPRRGERARRFTEIGRHLTDEASVQTVDPDVLHMIKEYVRHCHRADDPYLWVLARDIGMAARRFLMANRGGSDELTRHAAVIGLQLSNLVRDLASATGHQDALELSRQAVDLLSRTRERHQHDFLIAAGTHAADQRIAGEWASAHGWDELAVSGLTRLLGDDHPWTVRAKHNLAISASFMGRPHHALLLGRSRFKDLRRFGNDAEVWGTVRNVAYYLRVLDHVDESYILLSDAIAQVSDRTDVAPRMRLNLLSGLAISARMRGEPQEGLFRDKELLPEFVRRFGPEDRDTLRCAVSYAAAHYRTGDSAEAAEHAAKYLRIAADGFPRNPIGPLLKCNLAVYLDDLGRTEEACQLAREAFDGLSGTLGPSHVLTIGAGINFGNILVRTGRIPEATQCYAEARKRALSLFGREHNYWRTASDNLRQVSGKERDAGPWLGFVDLETIIF
ncbi:FxSxx-COOH system tetratricopeptide repeat protein [Acrocarpospora catenulata]|uniref:FxSxx-COOH system tetratricopeptide repeat protein n=1 Tax=Acrocarpospora catenulata TaxID=2836182 RepID=UPI001BDA30D0|nr:FxSxx-COOH system tetratricopeptide repeat protein [Acrocarpospora catenulata]